MKKLLTTLALFGTLVYAQQGRGKVQDLKERLKLTPEQSQQIQPIIQDQMNQLRALREQNGENRRKFAADARRIRQETDEKLKPILTAEQRAELDKMRSERKSNRRR